MDLNERATIAVTPSPAQADMALLLAQLDRYLLTACMQVVSEEEWWTCFAAFLHAQQEGLPEALRCAYEIRVDGLLARHGLTTWSIARTRGAMAAVPVAIGRD